MSAGGQLRTRLKTLAQDHLQQAYYILQVDESFAEARRLIARTLDVMDRVPEDDILAGEAPANVVRFRPLERAPGATPLAQLVQRRRGGAAEG